MKDAVVNIRSPVIFI